jgi:hypothetical protein
MIWPPSITSPWARGELGAISPASTSPFYSRVVIMPHVKSTPFVDKESLDPASYWHATIEELREEREERVSPIFTFFIYIYNQSFTVGLGESEMVLEEVRF